MHVKLWAEYNNNLALNRHSRIKTLNYMGRNLACCFVFVWHINIRVKHAPQLIGDHYSQNEETKILNITPKSGVFSNDVIF